MKVANSIISNVIHEGLRKKRTEQMKWKSNDL